MALGKDPEKNGYWDIIILPGKTDRNYWSDLWRFKELFYILSWRDIKVRYKQTVLGIAWSVIRPILTTIIFSFIFHKVAKLESNSKVPYPLMVFAGMLPWQFFSNSLTECSNSLIGNINLINKIYFPRMIIPASSIITSLMDLLISLFLLIIMCFYYNYIPSVNLLFLPFFIVLVFWASFGLGMYLTAANVKYRDFRYLIPFIVQFGLYVSPVGFNSNIIDNKWRILYSLNPMVGIIDGFRWCIIGTPLDVVTFSISFVVIILVSLFGIYYFRKFEKSFADNI